MQVYNALDLKAGKNFNTDFHVSALNRAVHTANIINDYIDLVKKIDNYKKPLIEDKT